MNREAFRMRIVKVSFKNLNSLAGDWTVDFEHPELQDAGIFLISGPTGAGKTTILDAITLALYGKTPRMTPTASRNDVMTRKCDNCLAEVYFDTPKGRFRSYWGHSLNRNKSEITRELVNETTGAICDKKERSEFMRDNDIMEYGQFVKSVLLAQGEFTAFLKAREDEKAAILEQLTDTNIYFELSRQTYLKEKEERLKKEELERDDARLQPLPPEELNAKQKELAALELEAKELGTTLQKLEGMIRWAKAVADRKAEVTRLELRKEELNQEAREFAPQLEILAAAHTAREFVSQYEILTASRVDLDNLKKQFARLTEQGGELEKEFADWQARASQLEEITNARNVALMEAQPLLEACRRLDRDIRENLTERQKQANELAGLQSDSGKTANNLKDKKNQLARAEESLAELRTWLAENSRDEWLVANCAALKTRIGNYGNAWDQIVAIDRNVSELEKRISATKSALLTKTIELGKQDDSARRLDAILSDLEARKAALCGGKTLRDLIEEAAAIKSLEEHRRNLKPGDACPLCGSLVHPYKNKQAQVDILGIRERDLEKQVAGIEEAEREIKDCQTRKNEALNAASLLKVEISGLEESLNKEGEQRNQLIRERATQLVKVNAVESEIRTDLESLRIEPQIGFRDVAAILDERLDLWQKSKRDAENADRQIVALANEIRLLEVQLENQAREIERRQAALAALSEKIAGSQKERNDLLGDRNVDAEEKRLKGLLEQARNDETAVKSRLDKVKNTLNQINGQKDIIRKRQLELEPKIAGLASEFQAALAKKGWDEAQFLAARRPDEEIGLLQTNAERLKRIASELEGSLKSGKEELAKLLASNLTDRTTQELESERNKLGGERDAIIKRETSLRDSLKADENLRNEKAGLSRQLAAQKEVWRRWKELYDLIGSEDGKKFRIFAQSITLDLLLAHANAQLVKIRDRYRLQRAPNPDPGNPRKRYLDIEVVDAFHDNQARPIENLSGGETFIVSLALSLGLASMAGKQAMMGSLFLDEGFGSLDEASLETALDVMGSLSNEGKLIGIISHVEALKDRIPSKIEVEPGEMGRSRLSGPGVQNKLFRKEKT